MPEEHTPGSVLGAFIAQYYPGKPIPREILVSHAVDEAILLGEVLAAWITGAPVPLASSLMDAIDPARFIARAARACGDTLHHVAEVSEGRVVFELEGPKAREVLSKGCSLDLHPRVFGAGQCAQTLLHHANILLEASGSDRFRFYTDRSLAGWMSAWLADATLEYRAG